jgi:hypothetical protein
MLVLGISLLLGLATGFLLGRRKLPVEAAAQPAVEHLGKPIARQILTTAGKEAVTRAIRERDSDARRPREIASGYYG